MASSRHRVSAATPPPPTHRPWPHRELWKLRELDCCRTGLALLALLQKQQLMFGFEHSYYSLHSKYKTPCFRVNLVCKVLEPSSRGKLAASLVSAFSVLSS